MEVKRKRSGHVCSYKNCENKSYNVDETIKFFRFPKDEDRCNVWIKAANRMDLMGKTPAQLYNSYRLCSEHFDSDMFMNWEKKSLLSSAVPKEFSASSKRINIIEDILITPAQTSQTEPLPKKVKIQDIVLPEKIGETSRTSSVSTQTTAVLGVSIPRKEKLRMKLAGKDQEVKKIKKELFSLSKKKESEATRAEFESLCDKFLTPEISNFVKAQSLQMNRSIQGRRYSDEFKKFALALYFVGPKCYRQLKKIFFLPSPSVLSRFLRRVQFHPGCNINLFNILKLKVDNLRDMDKKCVVCIDEITIKPFLYYDIGKDLVVGLEDNGTARTSKVAGSATVVMVRGISSNWKQAVAYTFASTSCTATDAKQLLDSCIEELCRIGLDPVVVISDMGSNFIELSKKLGVTEDNPLCQLGGKTLVYIFDPPHLMKATRNNLMVNHFCWDNKKACWEDITFFYEKDKNLKNRLAPKLTKSHLYPNNFEKMRVKFAVQALSRTVAAALETYVELKAMPSETLGTVEFISIFDHLFDIFNSTKLNDKGSKKPFCGDQSQIEFLSHTSQFLNNLKAINHDGKDVTNYMKFITCWKISIAGLLKLWDIVKNEGFQFLFTKRLNQDCLENFFGSVRQQQGNNVNPTPVQFTGAFRKLFVINYLHTKDMNCSEDFGTVLSNLAQPEKCQIPEINTDNHLLSSLRVEGCDYHEKTIPEQNAFKYICGYLLDKCARIHSCETCRTFSTNTEKVDTSNLFIHLKAYETKDNPFGGLKTAPESFCNYIYSLEQAFYENFEMYLTGNVGGSIYSICKDIEGFAHPCDQFPLVYLIKLYIRFRIYITLKTNNKNFKTQTRRNRKISILQNF